MAQTVGNLTHAYVSTVSFLQKREIYPFLIDVTREEVDLFDFMALSNAMEKTIQPDYHHFENAELFAAETINSSITDNSGGSGQGDITFTLTTAGGAGTSFPRVGDKVYFPSGYQGYVFAKTNGSSDQIRVKATLSTVTTANLAAANGQVLLFPVTIAGEGSTSPSSRRLNPVKRANQISIYKEAKAITDIQGVSETEIKVKGSNFSFIKGQHEAWVSFKKGINHDLLFSQISDANFAAASPSLVDPSSNPVQTTRGLREYITSFGLNQTSVTVGLTAFETLVKNMAARRAPGEYMVYMGTYGAIPIDNFFNAMGSAPELENARFSVDGMDLDFGVRSVRLYGKTFNFKKLTVMDDPTTVAVTSGPRWDKELYFVPRGTVGTIGGPATQYMVCKYMPVGVMGAPGQNLSGTDYIHEAYTGKFAPQGATNDTSTLTVHYQANLGLEVRSANQFARWALS